MTSFYRHGTRVFGVLIALSLFTATQLLLSQEKSLSGCLVACVIMGTITLFACRFGISPRIKLRSREVDVEQIFWTRRIQKQGVLGAAYKNDAVVITTSRGAISVFAFSASLIARLRGDSAAKRAVEALNAWRTSDPRAEGESGEKLLLWEVAAQAFGIYLAYFLTMAVIRALVQG